MNRRPRNVGRDARLDDQRAGVSPRRHAAGQSLIVWAIAKGEAQAAAMAIHDGEDQAPRAPRQGGELEFGMVAPASRRRIVPNEVGLLFVRRRGCSIPTFLHAGIPSSGSFVLLNRSGPSRAASRSWSFMVECTQHVSATRVKRTRTIRRRTWKLSLRETFVSTTSVSFPPAARSPATEAYLTDGARPSSHTRASWCLIEKTTWLGDCTICQTAV